MARRLVLVPESWAQKGNKVPVPSPIVTEEKEQQSENENIISLFPKTYRTKAKLLMHYIPDIKLNNQGRVLYTDGSLGSSLYDLVRYFVSSMQMSSPRPLDAPQFAALLKEAGVPQSALGSGRSLNSVEWQRIS